MKRLFNLFICLLLCFSFITFVNAENTDNMETDNYNIEDGLDDNDVFPEDDEDISDDGEYEEWPDEEEFPGDEENFPDDSEEWMEDEGEEPTYEDDLYNDANEENSQTGDIPIILISSIAIISLIVVLSKKNTFVNNGY